MQNKSLFIALPMSSIQEHEYLEIRQHMLQLVAELKASSGCKSIYFAGDVLENNAAFSSPAESARLDLHAIEKCDVFILIYPAVTPTSAIFEAGYAHALGKTAIYCSREGVDLPFLLRELPGVQYHSFRDWSDIEAKLLGFDSIRL